MKRTRAKSAAAAALLNLPLFAYSLVDPSIENTVARNTYVDPLLTTETEFIPLSQTTGETAALSELSLLSDSWTETKIDIKSGKITKLDLNEPLFPGDNRLLWRVSTDDATKDEPMNLEELAVSGLQSYISQISSVLSIDDNELFSPDSVRSALHDNGSGSLIQLSLERRYKNIVVRDSRAFGTVKNGNLVMFGLNKWGEIEDLDVTPSIDVEDAKRLLAEFAEEDLIVEGDGELNADDRESLRGDDKFLDVELKMEILDLCTPQLQVLILDNNEGRTGSGNSPRYLKRKKHGHKKKKNDSAPTFDIGSGYKHALVWRICPKFTNQKQEIMEGLVDAHTGQIYSFVDKIDYFTGVASVYPVSNDGQIPDGILQPGYPMPFLTISGDGEVVTTDTGGSYWSVGEKTVSFSGEFVHMEDQCGEAKLTIEGDFDWGGVQNGTDCDTPGYGGDGNTQASRSGYYELNRIMELARSHLPGNGWLKRRLVAIMNIPQSCNAFWDGSTVNFYRSSAQCSNTGEIAGVFDHEWGHGLDNNDLTPTIVKPSGEGIADIYTALRLGDSCIGRGFFNNPCSQFGDPCINDCTGVRDIDFEQHQSKAPHTLTWTNANCGSAENVHCRGLVYSEAIWSLWKRDLPDFYGYDDNTALEIVMRLTFIAAGNVATWYSGSPPYGGCGGDSGYLSYLLADDDDGDISNGTPHMQAIFAAHNRQEIACDEPTVQDSGCNDSPRDAPELIVTPGSMENLVSWSSVADAVYYQIFRTEGVYGCSQGKVLLATVSSNVLNYTDTGLMNGREYYYLVIPKGSDDACFGPASECKAASPIDGPAFQFTCQNALAVVNKKDSPMSTNHQCTLYAVSNFTGTISVSCDTSAMESVNCTVPSTIIFSAGDVHQNVPVTIDATSSTPVGQKPLTIVATDGTTERKADVSVVVVMPGGNLTAAYDPVIGTPRCVVSSSKCSSGDLLDGKGVDEVNSPNVLQRECNDGIWGQYHVHPSNDRIVVKAGRLDGTGSGLEITERSYATISATVWSTFATSCFADFYYTNNVSNPSWEYIGTQVTSKVRKPEVLQMEYEIPTGFEQAVRVNFRYNGSVGTCPSGGYRNYGDADDLVFTVKESNFYVECPNTLVVVNTADAPINNTKNCTLYTATSFSGTINFSCDASAITGVNCLSPSAVQIASGGQEMTISYVVESTASVVGGQEDRIQVFAESNGVSKKSSFPMIVVSDGGSQNATYDGLLGAPRCFAQGSECLSGGLLDGRGEVGPEPNWPNSLDDCTDGSKGEYRVDEQSDAITIRSGRLDGTGSGNDISEGEYITIAATVFAFNKNDRADFWHTTDVFNPSWTYIGSVYSKETNATEVIKVEYKLPQGSNQAVRVRYDYQGNVSTCPETDYGDVDDLVFAVKYVPFYISCLSELVIFNIEDAPFTSKLPCTIFSQSDFEGSIDISCDASELSGVDCISESPIDIQLGVLETNITISVNVSSSAIAGESGDLLISARDATTNLTKTSPINVLIIEGGGAQTAAYDPELGAPRCYAEGSSCSSGQLLDGRGAVGEGEKNAPNTIDDCEDGSWGNYHQHPSNDAIVVKGKNGNVEMSEYDEVIVSATVWSTMPNDLSADFYYTSTPEEPDWTFIDTLVTSKTGEAEVLELNYFLPTGPLQAVRVNFRYKGSVGECPSGNYWNYGDADDLVFKVKQASFSIICHDDSIRINKENTPSSVDVECTLSMLSNYTGTINLSCSSSSLTGVNCTTPPSIEILPGNTTANFTVKLNADTSVVVGEQGDVLVLASGGTSSKTALIAVSVVNPGGDQMAHYDPSYAVPVCDLIGSSCSSGDLLYGRGPVTPEPNYPNTLDDCADGAKGDHHVDESIDRIVVRSGRRNEASNETITEGSYITILANVWAYSLLDSGDFFIATNPNDPSWQYIGSVNASVADALNELVLETILPQGQIQAVRVNFHYRTSQNINSCLGGDWDDVDDLVFAVQKAEDATPSASPSSILSVNPTTEPPTTSPVFTASPTKTPSSAITMFSSIDWNIACNEISNNDTLVQTAQVFELSIKQTLEPTLSSNQELNGVTAAEICGVAVPDHNPISSVGRKLQATSAVIFTMDLEETCAGCSNNSTAANDLFEQVNNDLNTAVNSGQLTDTLQTNGQAANLTALGNTSVVSNSTESNYTIVTSSPTSAPSSRPSSSPTIANQSPPSANPSKQPGTAQPSSSSSTNPTSAPTKLPTQAPSAATPAPITQQPTAGPTSSPSRSPTASPSKTPSLPPVTPKPSSTPTQAPSSVTAAPTTSTSQNPTKSVKWYMNFSTMKCYQDCEGDYPCGGKKEFWNDSYSSLNECCITNLGTSDMNLTNDCYAGGM